MENSLKQVGNAVDDSAAPPEPHGDSSQAEQNEEATKIALKPTFDNKDLPKEGERAQSPNPQRKGSKKRHSNTHDGSFKKCKKKKSSAESYFLPNKFYLGGNINDPLNLEGVDNEGNVPVPRKSRNDPSRTPVSTKDQQIPLLVPADLSDPLRLGTDGPLISSINNSKKKRKKARNKSGNKQHPQDSKLSTCEDGKEAVCNETPKSKSQKKESRWDGMSNVNYSTDAKKDPIVSPAIRQDYSQQITMPNTKAARKRKLSLLLPSVNDAKQGGQMKQKKPKSAACNSDTAPGEKYKEGQGSKKKKREMKKTKNGISAEKLEYMIKSIKFDEKRREYQYGNYKRYYGYRCSEKFNDPRIDSFTKDWFKDKDVLDVGCNSGQFTILIARNFGPRKIVGVDIDDKLIQSARANIQHYSTSLKRPPHSKVMTYPSSFASQYGSLTGPPLETGAGEESGSFPNNVTFHQGNYVPETPTVLDAQEPEYDVIMCLSVTKWLHLNWGDDGLKKTFMRMFKQLRPGGKLILEPQPWKSYAKKNKISETIYRNFHAIELKPDNFGKYLTEKIGFVDQKALKISASDNKVGSGFNRPLFVFTKPE